MNKKAQNFLNMTEILVAAFFIFFSFMFLTIAKTAEYEEAEAELVDIRSDYYNTQSMRALLQTPVHIDSEVMTFSQAANNYYELLYLKSIKKGSKSEQLVRVKSIEKYELALKNISRTTIIPFLTVTKNVPVPLSLYFVLNERIDPKKKLFLGHVKSPTSKIKSYESIQLYIPAYFEDLKQLPGSYYIILSLGKFKMT